MLEFMQHDRLISQGHEAFVELSSMPHPREICIHSHSAQSINASR